MPPFARLTFAIGSPVEKCETSSTSMLVYGWPQRSTGRCSIVCPARATSGWSRKPRAALETPSDVRAQRGFRLQAEDHLSINSDRRCRSEAAERTHAAHAVPRVRIARLLALSLVTLEESG